MPRKKTASFAVASPTSAKRHSGTHEGPSFRNPPVDEVVCGIRFEPLANFKVPYTGLFWLRFRPEYENVEHAAPIASGSTISIDTATGAPLPRMWFSNKAGDGLIQFQVDCLYYNWRRREGVYPRFKRIFPKFEEVKSELDALLKDLKQAPPVLLEHELTYINHIPQGDGWQSLTDLPEVLPIFCAAATRLKFLPTPRNLAWSARFELPEELGHLEIKLSQGARRTDKHPILLLQLSARGKAAGPSWDSSKAWFEMAHNWIVNGFADITSPAIQQSVWKREDGTSD